MEEHDPPEVICSGNMAVSSPASVDTVNEFIRLFETVSRTSVTGEFRIITEREHSGLGWMCWTSGLVSVEDRNAGIGAGDTNRICHVRVEHVSPKIREHPQMSEAEITVFENQIIGRRRRWEIEYVQYRSKLPDNTKESGASKELLVPYGLCFVM